MSQRGQKIRFDLIFFTPDSRLGFRNFQNFQTCSKLIEIEEATVQEDCETLADQIGLADDLNLEGCLFGWA